MFDDEADTIPLDASVIETLRTKTLEVVIEAPISDTIRAEPMLEFEDTPISVPVAGFDLHPTFDEAPPTDKQRFRPGTDGEWPPAPKPPTVRTKRRAGVYKAITSITKLTKLAKTS